MDPMTPIAALLADLADGRTTSRALTEACLARAKAPDGEGARVFTLIDDRAALAAADAADALRAAGIDGGPLLGLPVSVKDLFDVKGQVTAAGSVVRADDPPATADAPAVRRLRAAGAVVVGRTNMTEFAFSGVGLNPHHGTPRNPWDRATGRIPGGSSAGAAVSVTDGMAAAALGTDTGGSVRIPAGLCGLAGFKPTQARVPRDGAFPLSYAMDSVGPLAPTVACCALLDAVLAGAEPVVPEPMPIKDLRVAVPQGLVLDDMDESVAERFETALHTLSAAGVHVDGLGVADLLDTTYVARQALEVTVEAWSIHRHRAATDAARFDQRVLARMKAADGLSAADVIDLQLWRKDFQRRWNVLAADYDALLWPTLPTLAPTIAQVDADEESYNHWNRLMLRNTRLVNVLDGCAATIPIHRPREAAVGLQVVGPTGADTRTLRVALALEAALSEMRDVP
ncbi:Asp-tRNAAsn/Glu-tRNAGln amidotransferase A subunit [Caenispirillum salinarum AK4]|uniref:Asp-tRNAAsn/Glu-tRNAGln amidotransferase A subunit n=1 Tax=Caenispirillum salinarum AK4 TaxID=1238182 RepID=K9H2N7_9PROT|nr:amidase [Caenispirillum salinarum]EKV32515.1 Asp-tRNAAsn/Glu-tRNAGln amidotransferase A subunit [Caenispirillum salinarum AK4]